MILKSETVIPDDYPVYYGYLYVCDGLIAQSDIQGTVSDLKRDLQVKEVRRYDFIARHELAMEAALAKARGETGERGE